MVEVRIYILSEGESHDMKTMGKFKSDAKELKVNKIGSWYTVVLDENVFMSLDNESLVKSLSNVFMKNMPGEAVNIIPFYDFDDNFDKAVGNRVIMLNNYLSHVMNHNLIPNVLYEADTENIKDIVEFLNDDDYDPFDDFFDDDDEDDDEDDEDDEDPFAQFGFIENPTFNRKHPKKSGYGTSKIYRHAKNPKKAIKRHGVLIAESKSDMKSDEKRIREFLKELIPGGADWKREYRDMVANRWINCYAVSRKQLKKLEKKHQQKKSDKKSRKNTKKALDFTTRLLTPIDNWSNPRK